MSAEHIAILILTGIVVTVLLINAWLSWQPVKRLSTVELQVQEFNRQVRDWNNANQNGWQ